MSFRLLPALQALSKGAVGLSARVNQVVRALLVCASTAMIVVVLLQVICRYLFNDSLSWSEELARMLLVQITFLGAAAAFYGRSHIAVDFVSAVTGPKTKRLLHSACILVCAALFTAMLVYGLQFAQTLYLQQAASLPLNLAAPFMIIPISGGIMLLHSSAMLLEQWVGPASRKPKPDNIPPGNQSAGNNA